MPNEQVHTVRLRDIRVSRDNVRHTEQEKDLQELADSIRRHKQLQPVVLMGEYGVDPPYQLIVGQRRFLALRDILGAKDIKATFIPELTDTDAIVMSLAENMCRSDLTYKDAADAVTRLYQAFHHNDKRVARETGLSLKKVRQYIYIEARASSETKKKLREGKVKPVDVHRALRAASDDIDKADKLLAKMKDYDKYQKQRMVEYGQQNPSATIKEIVTNAEQPRVERQVIVRLSDKARAGLAAASKKMSMEPDEIAARAVEEWLSNQGFIE